MARDELGRFLKGHPSPNKGKKCPSKYGKQNNNRQQINELLKADAKIEQKDLTKE